MLNEAKKRFRLRIVIPEYPTFNIYSRIAKRTTALGPICVASVVDKMEQWNVEVIDENNMGKYAPRNKSGKLDHEYLQNHRPADVVGFYGGLTSTVNRLYNVASYYKQRGINTIAGGQHFMGENIKEAINSSIDYVVRGEGELTIKELLKALEGKKEMKEIKGIAYKKNGNTVTTPSREPITDLDELPLPDFSLLRYGNMKLYPVGRTRGCGMDCEFCTVKGRPRSASPERLVNNISYLLETYDARHFFIVDDLFGQQRSETIRFCNRIKEYQEEVGVRLDITAQIRLDKAKDPELLSVMRKANINTLAIGFESPIEEELKAMNKNIRPEEMVSLAKKFHDFGFLIHGMFIFGYPLKNNSGFDLSVKKRIKRYRDFIRKAKIDTIQILLPVPLPGTELRERLEEENRIFSTQDVGWEYYDGNFPLFEPDNPVSAEDLHKASKNIMAKFYRFRYIFMILLNVISFPTLIFFLHNIKSGWRKWYRNWRNHLVRFGGWLILKEWLSEFRKDNFLQKLYKAKVHLNTFQEVKYSKTRK